jgi:hypothetical protein
MKWLAVTRNSRLETDLASPEMILHAHQFSFSKSDEKVIIKKRCKGVTSFLFEGTVPDLSSDARNDEEI